MKKTSDPSPHEPRSQISQPHITAMLYLVLFAYFYSFSEYGFNIWDEGGYANGTLRTYNGQTALKDFNPNGYLPGRYLYGAFFFKLFGVSIQSLRLGVLLLTPAMILMVYAIARKIMASGFAFLAALFMVSAPSMYYNRFFTIFCVVSLFCLLEFVEKRGKLQLFWLIGSIVIGFFFKVEVALFSAVISAVVIAIMCQESIRGAMRIENLKSHAASGMRFWMPTLSITLITLWGVYYIFKIDLFNKFFALVVEAHHVWGTPFPVILPLWEIYQKIGAHEMFERILFYLPMGVYAIILVLLGIRFLHSRSAEWTSSLHLLAIVSFGICAFGLVIWRAGFDNLLRTLPPFYILFCYLLSRIWEWIARSPGLQELEGKPIGHLMRKTALNLFIVFLPFVFYYEMNMNHGFYAGSVGAIKKETALLRMNRIEVYTRPAEAQSIRGVVHYIKANTQKGDPIFSLPLNPIFYFLTDRVNPTIYDWILPGMLDEEKQKEVVEVLKANKPKLMVYVDIPIDGKEERRFSNYAPHIFDFIIKNYRLEELFGFFQILTPIESGPP